MAQCAEAGGGHLLGGELDELVVQQPAEADPAQPVFEAGALGRKQLGQQRAVNQQPQDGGEGLELRELLSVDEPPASAKLPRECRITK